MNLFHKKNNLNIIFSIIILFSVLNMTASSPVPGRGHGFITGFSKTLGEAKKTLDETKSTLEGLSRFVKTISHSVSVITGVIGFRAILLLFFVMLVSNALSFLAIPRGKASFLLSLVLVNILWITWAQSFSPGSTEYIGSIAKTNLTLIIPVITLIILSKLFTRLRGKMSGLSLFSFLRRRKGTCSEEELIQRLEQFQKESLIFQQSLIADVRQGSEKKVRISHKTGEALADVERTLKLIKRERD